MTAITKRGKDESSLYRIHADQSKIKRALFNGMRHC